jgi:hypothetical protein
MADTPAAALVVLLGGYATAMFGRSLCYGWSSRRWPCVPAQVLASDVGVTDVGGRRGPVNLEGAAIVSYEYVVRGETYLGDRIAYGPQWWWLAARETRRYPLGKRVEVAYDPVSPERCVLRPGVTWSTALTLPVGVALLMVGLLWLAQSLVRA